jgi:hypothetical protein
MANHRDPGRRRTPPRISAALVVALPLLLAGSAGHAQGMMRSPTINIGARVPTIAPTVAARTNPNIAGRGVANVAGRGGPAGIATIAGRTPGVAVGTIAGRSPTVTVATPSRIGVTSVAVTPAMTGRVPVVMPKIALPTVAYVRYSPNTYPGCAAANRAASGECRDGPFVADLGGSAGGPPPRSQNPGAPRRTGAKAGADPRTVAGQIVAELDGALSDAQVDELARRYRLTRLGMQNFPLVGATIGLFRIADGRSVDTVQTQLRADAGVRAVQPNFRYVLQDQASRPASNEGDPAQYALAKLRLPEAHRLAHGSDVTVAVIDSGIDVAHPELAGAIAGTFDALGSKEGAHVHGTGIAGAIVAHGRLMGSAPRARILAIRAFGAAQGGAESTSFVLVRALDHAASHGARVINMSFAGPQDALVERAVSAAAGRGIVLVAASGNAGPKSPPLYPAAHAGVIAVSATDAYDRLFVASTRGRHIAVAAPGVDIFLPAPDNKYQMTSGTSFSAAYISGLAALMIERNPTIKPEELRAILMQTARDLGAPGRDDLFGAGVADAYGAVSAVQSATPAVAAAPPSSAPELVSDAQPAPATRGLGQPAPSMASDVPAAR